MSKTYSNQKKIEHFREPLFNIKRQKFRGSRSSQSENLETNLMKLDLSRIQNELDTISDTIDEDIIYLIGNIDDVNAEILADDGLSYMIDGVEFYNDNTSTTEDLSLDTMNKVSGRLSRLFNKVQRLEMEN